MSVKDLSPDERREHAGGIVQRFLWWSAGGGVIPIPIVDIAAVSFAQYRMVRSLAEYYEVPYSEDTVKTIIAALVGGTGSHVIAYGSVGGALKAVPGIGTLFGTVAMPTISAAVTYALGKLFIEHFETGGTLLDFDADKMRSHYEKLLKEKSATG